MQRAERIGLGVALAGHILLFALLSVSFHPPIDPALYKPKPIEVSLADPMEAVRSVVKSWSSAGETSSWSVTAGPPCCWQRKQTAAARFAPALSPPTAILSADQP